jgi:uncharacterized membrane protein
VDITSIGGLPAHPLLVHVPIVLVPLAFLGALALAIRRPWVSRFGGLLLIVGFVAAAGTAIASQAGETLRDQVPETDTVRRHADLAETTKVLVALFFLLLLVWIVLDVRDRRRSGRATAATAAAGAGDTSGETAAVGSPHPGGLALRFALPWATVLFGLLATVWIVRTGHDGAKATWQNRQLVQRERGGDGG